MRNIISIIAILTLIKFSYAQNLDSIKLSDNKGGEGKTAIQYSDLQLENFLDSVGQLPSKPLMDKVSFYSDSIFKSQEQLNISINENDFSKLKNGCKDGYLDIGTAIAIFGDIKIDSDYLRLGTIPLTYISFDKNKDDFKEFAICPGNADAGWSCVMYFFSGNKIIVKHQINHRYGLDLNHYLDKDGKTVIYYKENYESGTGIWWFNYYFYKYDNGKLIPILNEIQNGNLQYGWSYRTLWLESTILKTSPLTIKMVYNQGFTDSSEDSKIIDASTIIKYKWDESTKTLIGDYEKSKISKAQILTYYLEDNELLYINANYKTLKSSLNNKTKRNSILNYLNKVKNANEIN